MEWKVKLKGKQAPSGPIQVHIQVPGQKQTGEPSYPAKKKTHLFGARKKR